MSGSKSGGEPADCGLFSAPASGAGCSWGGFRQLWCSVGLLWCGAAQADLEALQGAVCGHQPCSRVLISPSVCVCVYIDMAHI